MYTRIFNTCAEICGMDGWKIVQRGKWMVKKWDCGNVGKQIRGWGDSLIVGWIDGKVWGGGNKILVLMWRFCIKLDKIKAILGLFDRF